ncbi:MAG: TIGR03086 family metal-binding protein [Acidimicrobiales bacterium]
MSEEMLAALDEVYGQANRLVAGVASEQWSAPTPCDEWDVRALVNHMVGTSKVLHASASRTAPSATPDDEHLGDDPVSAFRVQGDQTLAAWRRPGALEGEVDKPVEMPAVAALGVNITDLGTHCWDLATATGQSLGLSDGTIEIIDQWNHILVTDDVRAWGGFGEILEPSSDAQLDRMLAYVGRSSG